MCRASVFCKHHVFLVQVVPQKRAFRPVVSLKANVSAGSSANKGFPCGCLSKNCFFSCTFSKQRDFHACVSRVCVQRKAFRAGLSRTKGLFVQVCLRTCVSCGLFLNKTCFMRVSLRKHVFPCRFFCKQWLFVRVLL